jgi:hypothetical protein
VNRQQSRIEDFNTTHLLSESWRSESSVTMTTKQLGSMYLLIPRFSAPRCSKTTVTLLEVLKGDVRLLKVLGLIRSNEYQVVGIAGEVRLSSKFGHRGRTRIAPVWTT